MSQANEILLSLSQKQHLSGMVRVATTQKATGNGPMGLAKGASLHAPHTLDERAVDWQARLLSGELLRGGAVELSSQGGLALGTSVALRACRRVQDEARQMHGIVPWCAFIDPTASLYAPGVHAAGVELSKLLVVRPDPESLIRVTLRLVESKVFPVVVVDLMGMPCDAVEASLGSWVRVVRRLSLSLGGGSHSVILLTNKNAPRPLPLPVSERLVLSRSSVHGLHVTVTKSVQGGLGNANIRWDRTSPNDSVRTNDRVRTNKSVEAHVS